MKIKDIQISRFRSHVSTSLKDLGERVLVLGPNGSGKSGLLDALAYGVTGSCRGTDEAGRGWESLQSPSPAGSTLSSAINIQTDRGLISRIVGSGPKSAAQDKINAMLGLSRVHLRCAMRSQAFLDLEQKEQEALMRDLCSSAVTVERVREALGENADGLDLNYLLSIDGVVSIYQTLYSQRREAKLVSFPCPSEPEHVEFAGKTTKGASDADLMTLLKQVEASVSAAAAARGSASQRGRIEGEIAALNGDLEAMRERIKPYRSSKEIMEEIQKLAPKAVEEARLSQERRSQAEEFLKKARAADAAEGNLRQTFQRLSSMMSGSERFCDACRQAINKNQLRIIIDDISKEIKEKEKDSKSLHEAARRLDSGGLLPSPTESSLAKLRKDLEDIRVIRENAKSVKERIAVAQQKLSAIGNVSISEAEYQALVDAKAKVSAHVAYRTMAAESISKSREQEARIEKLNRQVEALAQGGPVRALHMGKGLADLISQVQDIARVLGVGKIEITTSPRWSIKVDGRYAELLSASERFRVSLAFAAVIAKRTGVNMVCLDGADILDDNNRGALVDLLERLGLEQVIVTATSVSGDVQMEGWKVIRITNEAGTTRVA